MIDFLSAIVFVKISEDNYSAKKYTHNIKDTQHYVSKFCNDMKRKFPTAEYINFYYKKDGAYKERILLE
jgi:hypothetical protein